MFGGKKIKEAEDKIQELELIQNRHAQMTEDIQKIRVFTDEIFANLEAQNLQIDQGMNHLIDRMQQEKQSGENIAERTTNLAEGLKQVEENSSQWMEETRQQEEQLAKGKEIATMLQETAALCEAACTKEQEKKENGNQAVQQALEKLGEMQKAAKNMATLALNAAIEAGRLGETGMAFLQAAEEVRKLSEEYMGSMDILKEQISAAGTLYEEEEVSQQLEQIWQKTKEAAQTSEIFGMEKQTTEINLAEQVSIQQELVRELAESLQEKEAVQQKLLEQMEFMQQNQADSRKMTGELEERLALFYGKAL